MQSFCTLLLYFLRVCTEHARVSARAWFGCGTVAALPGKLFPWWFACQLCVRILRFVFAVTFALGFGSGPAASFRTPRVALFALTVMFNAVGTSGEDHAHAMHGCCSARTCTFCGPLHHEQQSQRLCRVCVLTARGGNAMHARQLSHHCLTLTSYPYQPLQSFLHAGETVKVDPSRCVGIIKT